MEQRKDTQIMVTLYSLSLFEKLLKKLLKSRIPLEQWQLLMSRSVEKIKIIKRL